jgi:hypothetical protein
MLRRRGSARSHQVAARQIRFVKQLLEQSQIKLYSGAQHASLVELLVSQRAVQQRLHFLGPDSFHRCQKPQVRQQNAQRWLNAGMQVGVGARLQESEVNFGKE